MPVFFYNFKITHMNKPKSPLTKEEEQWILTEAWKTLTITQIAEKLKRSESTISVFCKRHDVKPAKQRDLVKAKILALIAQGKTLKVLPLSKELGCSQFLVRELLIELDVIKVNENFHGKTKRTVTIYQQAAEATEQQQKERIAAYEARQKDLKQRRAAYAVYTQTGSAILDELRGITTTVRENTLLSNNGKL